MFQEKLCDKGVTAMSHGHHPSRDCSTPLTVGDFPPHSCDILIGNVLCKTLKWKVGHEPAHVSDELRNLEAGTLSILQCRTCITLHRRWFKIKRIFY